MGSRFSAAAEQWPWQRPQLGGLRQTMVWLVLPTTPNFADI